MPKPKVRVRDFLKEMSPFFITMAISTVITLFFFGVQSAIFILLFQAVLANIRGAIIYHEMEDDLRKIAIEDTPESPEYSIEDLQQWEDYWRMGCYDPDYDCPHSLQKQKIIHEMEKRMIRARRSSISFQNKYLELKNSYTPCEFLNKKTKDNRFPGMKEWGKAIESLTSAKYTYRELDLGVDDD